jgi:hypothetical protein
MVVVAVSCELFSGEFPANREINRNLVFFGAPLCSGLLVSHRETTDTGKSATLESKSERAVTGQSRKILFLLPQANTQAIESDLSCCSRSAESELFALV